MKNRADKLPPIEVAQPDKLTIVPFTTFPGFEIAPSFSPDGNEIVFSWFGYEKEFQFDLYIKQVGQEHVVQLTHHPATFLVSAWSPDGRLIAFMRQADPESTGIYLISPLGGAERKVAGITAASGWAPLGVSWSPDGKWLAFSKGNSLAKQAGSSADHFSIHLVNVETSEERLLPDPSKDCGNTWQPAFSPDGKYLASVCVLAGGVAKIYLQTPDGKQARELKDARSSEGFAGIAWAEDSQSLLYCADQHLWRIPLAGGKPEMLLFAQDVESVAVASHGNRLAFAQVHHSGQVFQLALASQTKLTAPATKLISSTRGDDRRARFTRWQTHCVSILAFREPGGLGLRSRCFEPRSVNFVWQGLRSENHDGRRTAAGSSLTCALIRASPNSTSWISQGDPQDDF